jgi:hypothetical protein
MKLYDLLCSYDDSVKLACVMCEQFTEQEWTDALKKIWHDITYDASTDINRYWIEDEMYEVDTLSFGFVPVLCSTDIIIPMDRIVDICDRIIKFIEL